MAEITYSGRKILSISQRKEIAGGNFQAESAPQNYNVVEPDLLLERIQAAQNALKEKERKRLEALRSQMMYQEGQAKEQAAQDALRAENNVKLFGGFSNIIDPISDFFTSEAPNFNVTTDPVGNPLNKPEGIPDNKERGPERTGFTQQAVLNSQGNVAGYEYVKSGLNTAEAAQSVINMGASDNVTQRDFEVSSRLMGNDSSGYVSPDVMGIPRVQSGETRRDTRLLEENFLAREYAAKVKIYGEPTVNKAGNPDGTDQTVWGTNGISYLGMNPGELSSQALKRPDMNDPYSKWQKYEKKLESQIRLPNYTVDSPNAALNAMTVPMLKSFQNRLRQGGLYPPGHRLSLGRRGSEDGKLMTALMRAANISGGGEWDMVLDEIIDQQRLAVAQSGGGGGGGGGAGGGTTQINYGQTSMSAARTLLTSVLRDALGRSPTEEELAEFISEVNRAEGNNPTTTQTTTTRNGDNTRSVTRNDPSSVDTNEMAQDFAERIDPTGVAQNKQENYLQGYLSSLGV